MSFLLLTILHLPAQMLGSERFLHPGPQTCGHGEQGQPPTLSQAREQTRSALWLYGLSQLLSSACCVSKVATDGA